MDSLHGMQRWTRDKGELRDFVRKCRQLDGSFICGYISTRGDSGKTEKLVASPRVRPRRTSYVKRRATTNGSRSRASGDRATAERVARDEKGAPGPGLDASLWAAVRPYTSPQPKVQLTLRLDQDVIDWFRGQGRGYQTHINAALRSYMTHAPINESRCRDK